MDIIPLLYSVFIVFFPLISVFTFTPLMWKKNSAFGVILPKELKNNRELTSLKRNYTVFSLVSGVCFAATALIVKALGVVFICGVLYVAMCLFMFAVNNRLVRNIIAVKDYENVQKPVYIKNITQEFKTKTISFWWLLLLVIPAAVSFYDAYKNPAVISYVIFAILLFIIIADVIGFILIKKVKQYVNKNTAADDMKRNVEIRVKLSALVFVLSVVLSAFLVFMQTIDGELFIKIAPIAVTVIVTVCIIVFTIRINK